ncbi:MAG TPA: tetratricopeptide repeat protein [Candidatus Sulfotelmatobacter sp.]|nr:tetratricopeptide repeat protein [Candidatus Sulfotelmatobacter sp.]
MKSRGFVVVVLLFVASVAAAQFDSGHMGQQVRVRVTFSNGGCDASAHLILMGHGVRVADGGWANDKCEVNFNVQAGSYQLSLIGGSVASADLGTIEVTSSGINEFDVRVERPNDAGRNVGGYGNAFVSTSDLGIPSRARKEFDKASELISKRELDQAIQKLNKAISIYPGYAGAYNNLGVLYAWRGDRDRERESLETAIRLNDHFALAYLNLGRLTVAAGDFPAAEALLDKASTFDPTDPMALILLSWAEFQQGHFDEAIATCRKAHLLAKAHAFAHRVAARAFEQQRNRAGAVAELESYLREQPAGPPAEAARKELELVKKLP